MLIEFKGALTGASKRHIIKKQMNMQLLAAAFVSVMFGVPSIIAMLSNASRFLASMFLLAILIYDLFSILPPGKTGQRIFMPKRIFLNLDEGTIVHECEKMERFHMIDDVKKIIDYGEFYDFVFTFSARDIYFICQKDLLVCGTIEEFESLFEGKIERRIK